jgi:hypothetical protein
MAEDAKPQGPRKVSIWVKVFALIHLFCFVEWSLPDPPKAVKDGVYDCNDPIKAVRELGCLYLANNKLEEKNPLRFYVMSTGVWQSWDMFAPDPSSLDIYLDAEVTYTDGAKRIVPYPRMYDLSIGEKYIKERFRKYVERVNDDVNDWKWPQLGRYMAQVAYTDKNNPPVVVVMRRHFRYVAPQGDPQPQTYTDVAFSTYVVDFAQLRKDKPL